METEKITNPFSHNDYEVSLEENDDGIKIIFTGNPHIPAIHNLEDDLAADNLARMVIDHYSWRFVDTIKGYTVSVRQNLPPENLWSYKCVKGETVHSENICKSLLSAIKSGITTANIAE